MDPGPCLFENGCFGSFETFASTAKRTYLESFDVERCTSCGTRFSGRGIRADDVGEKRLILMLLKAQPIALIRCQAYGEFGTYWGDTSDLDRSVDDEDILKHVTRELWFPGLIFLMKTLRWILEVFTDTLVIEGECWNMQDMDAITVCTVTAILLDSAFWCTRRNAPVITGHSILGLLLRGRLTIQLISTRLCSFLSTAAPVALSCEKSTYRFGSVYNFKRKLEELKCVTPKSGDLDGWPEG